MEIKYARPPAPRAPACSRVFVGTRSQEMPVDNPILERERQARRDEIAIDLEDRGSKKGTPPRASEEGDIRMLRSMPPPPTIAASPR